MKRDSLGPETAEIFKTITLFALPSYLDIADIRRYTSEFVLKKQFIDI